MSYWSLQKYGTTTFDGVSRPSIAGTTMVRSVLTASEGTWSVPLTKITYQWLRCAADGTACADIAGATAKTYVAVAADVAKTLAVKVNATSPGRTASAQSEPTDVVAPLPPPAVTTAVAIKGTAARGQTLSVTPAVWTGYPTTIVYQWLRCDGSGDNCEPIANAKAASFALTKTDEGHTLRVKADATNTAGTASSTSEATAQVAAVAPVNTVAPAVTGTAVAGQTLSANRGTWVTTADTTYTYSWQRCDDAGANCAPIAAATALTYRLTDGDVDKTLKFAVTATNPDGAVPVTSATTAKIKAAPPAATVLPVLTGTAQVGKTVSATTGTWTGTTDPLKTTFYRCSKTCTAVAAGTDRTYTLVTADAGFTIRASVTGTGAGGTKEVYASATLGPVKAATAATALTSSTTPVSLKSTTGAVLARASVAKPVAGTAAVTVKPAATLKSGYKAWACPTGGSDWQPCTAPVKLGHKPAHLKVPLDAGEKVRVVVAKTK